MSLKLKVDYSKKNSDVKEYDNIPYMNWLNNHKEGLDKKWFEMNGPDTDMENDIEYITYMVDSFIEWSNNRLRT